MLKSPICLAKSGTFRTFAAENRRAMEERAKDHPADLFSVASIGKEYDLKARAWVENTDN